MDNIKDINITTRCGYKTSDKVADFLTPITTKVFRKTMRRLIDWKNSSNPEIAKKGVEYEEKYTKYLKSDIKDIPEHILLSYSSRFCTDDSGNFYIYNPCCR